MKRLLIALMAVSLVLVSVSFAAAQSSSSTATIESFQTIIPPGSTSAYISIPGLTATATTSYQFPVQSFNATVTGADSGFGTYSASANGGGGQSSHLRSTGSYHASQGGGAHVSIAGSAF